MSFLNNKSVAVGFTGSRQGMSFRQRAQVARMLRFYNPEAVHHGDCIGADADFAELCERPFLWTVIHPPISHTYRAHCGGCETRPEKSYLARNREIVRSCDVLIACPKETEEPPTPLRGQGTWSTIRFARKQGTEVLIVWPDGTVSA